MEAGCLKDTIDRTAIYLFIHIAWFINNYKHLKKTPKKVFLFYTDLLSYIFYWRGRACDRL